jgi:hypothetical protein
MSLIRNRIKALESKLSPKIGLPILIIDCTLDECDVMGEIMHRQCDESRDAFYDRVCAIYDSTPGIGMIIKIHAAERYDDDE